MLSSETLTLNSDVGVANDHRIPTADPPREVPITITIKDLRIDGIIRPETQVENFLGIPFGRIPARFRQAKLVDPQQEHGTIDASRFGPVCPQPPDVIHYTTAHLYPKMSYAERQAEFSCLNLNIYAPPMAVGSREKLPVLVWIHGGGFTYGDGTHDYDGNWIVQHSISMGRPIIVVALQYRLGYYGFLSSKELQDEARANGEVGFANVGLHDQRLGLQWIQQNIHLFGGDASAVTLSGESAGAWSVVAHMRSTYPGFQRAFVLSDAAIPLVTPEQSQEKFDYLVSSTGLSKSAPAADKIAALRDLSQADFAKLLESGAQPPVWDDIWFADQDLSLELEYGRPFPSWLEALVIGSAKHECAMWDPLWRRLNDEACVKLAEESVAGISSGDTILQEYGIINSPVDDKYHGHKAVEGLVRLATDGMFGGIPYTIASRHSELPVSMYRFDQTDDDPRSPAQGNAYHSMINAFFFNFPTVSGPEASEKARETSTRLVTAAITFAYGEQPWEPFSKGRKMMVFGGDEPGLRGLRSEDLRFLKFCASAEDYRAFTGAGRKLLVDVVQTIKVQDT